MISFLGRRGREGRGRRGEGEGREREERGRETKGKREARGSWKREVSVREIVLIFNRD